VLDNEFVYRIGYIVSREGQGTGVVIDYPFDLAQDRFILVNC